MISEVLDLQPVELLLARHREHHIPYNIIFKGLALKIYPEVFNPIYTRVSGFLAENIEISKESEVLDMFTGSGAIGLYAAKEAKHVIGVDISQKAIQCARENASALNLCSKTQFRKGNLWEVVGDTETFDVIIANPPLLPAIPEDPLEETVADSPLMSTTRAFINGSTSHLKENGVVYMVFSNACKPLVGDPLKFISHVADLAGLELTIKAEWDVGYEIYRILKMRRK
jgi:release factor glutamine methyltransferase